MGKNRTTRGLGTVGLTLLITALFVATAVPALAHHPEIEASARCAEDGLPYIDYVSTSWTEDPLKGTNPNIGIYVNGVKQDSGAYLVGSYQFSGSIEASAWEGQTVVVKAQADAPWGNGTAPGDFRETTVTVPTDCALDTVSVEVSVGTCRYDDNLSLTTVTVSIDPGAGATLTILKGEDVVATFTGAGGEVVLEPGEYVWNAQASQGFELTGAAEGAFTTGACPPPPPPPPPPALGAIGDLVWLDADADGYQGDFEAGVAGVTVNLLNGGGSVIATTVTDAGGKYLFTGLAGGTYEVQVVPPTGFEVSPLRAVAVAALDSDAGIAGRTGLISLPSGVTDLTWDAGIFEAPKVLPQVITTTTTPPETLPFTGVANGGAGGVAVALLALGSLIVLVVGRREEETESRAYGGGDS